MSDYTPWGPTDVRPRFVGGVMRLFWLALGRALLTIVTFGIGRFWMATRLRRYYWSSIQIDGAPLEYTGTALEKLIGFLIAVVILAVVLAGANLGLAFIGFSYFEGNLAVLNLSLLVLIPLGFWAQYRARRYILGRTRWRGVRFGVDPGAWGYALRATGWWFAVIFSLGLLYPMMQMELARYTTERTWFGDLRFHQGGGWGMLLPAWLLAIGPVYLAVGAILLDGREILADLEWDEDQIISAGPAVEQAVPLLSVAVFWFMIAYFRYNVLSFRKLTSHKVLGGETRFTSTLSMWSVLGVYLLGGLAFSVIFGIAAALLGGAAMATVFATSLGVPDIADLMAAQTGGIIAGALIYFALIALFIALTHVCFTQPLLKATIRSIRISGMEAAARAKQRDEDRHADAGGFADALGADPGGAF